MSNPQLIDVVIDFETFWDADYTLRRLTLIEYINDPRFEVIGVSLIINGSPPVWFSGSDNYLQRVFDRIPWDGARVIAHNAMFDGAILEWKFKHKPAKYLCTMMASRLYAAPFTGSMSLAKVARYFGLGEKGTEVMNAKGKRRSAFNAYELQQYGEYCKNDTKLAHDIAHEIDKILPADEASLVDLTIRKFTQPRIVLDRKIIDDRLRSLEVLKEQVVSNISALGATVADLRSRPKFGKLLRSFGADIPYKVSTTTGSETEAFAKNDEGMLALLVHPDPRVRTLAEAKIFLSSSMEGARLERFRSIHDFNMDGRHALPVPLLYAAAHTGRLGGYDKINMQNLTRVKRDKVSGAVTAGHLRFALRAPDGYSIVAADLSNIEARILAALAKCKHMVDGFAHKRDLYCDFATRIYGRTITKADEVERFVGKTSILGLGYGMGADKFLAQMQLARVKMSKQTANNIVYLYRDVYADIPNLWSDLFNCVVQMLPRSALMVYGPLTVAHERFILPNGVPLIYPGLCNSPDTYGVHYLSRRSGAAKPVKVRLWGGAITENVVQALAKIVISTAEVRLAKLGLRAVLQVHDELVFCVPTINVEPIKAAIEYVLCDRVPWLPSLPIACEIKHGPSYGDAK